MNKNIVKEKADKENNNYFLGIPGPGRAYNFSLMENHAQKEVIEAYLDKQRNTIKKEVE